MAETNRNYRLAGAIAIIVLAAIICYANSLHNPFIWDQEVVIVGHPLIRSWHNLPLVFKTNVEGKRLTAIGFYRPLEVISYMIDYSISKLNPFGYHCSSIFLHIGNSLLFFWLLKKMRVGRQISFLAALIFAIHPLNTETVTYSIRGDLLAAFFSLGSFLFFLSFGEGRRSAAFFSIFSYLLALLSKESAVVMPFIISAYLLLVYDVKRPSLFTLALALMAISFIYIFIRLGSISASSQGALSLISEAALGQRILTLPRILLTYSRLLIFPWHLHMEYHFIEKSLASPYVAVGAPFLLIVAYGFFKYVKSRYLIFFLAWFLVGLAPFYNLAVKLHATLLEHWAYLAGMGFIALEAALGFQIFHKTNNRSLKNLMAAGLIFLLAYYGGYTIKRNADWSEAMRLYQHDLKYEPNSFILHNNAGVMYFRSGEFKKAKEAFLKAIEVSPGRRYDVAYNNIGVIYENEGDLLAAETAFKTSLQLNNYELAYGNLSRLYLKTGRRDEAIRIALEGRELYPFNREICYYLAVGYYYNRQFKLARDTFEYLERLSPGYKNTSPKF